jgi:hypothetical protein
MAQLNSKTQTGLDHHKLCNYYDRVYYKEAGLQRTALNHRRRAGPTITSVSVCRVKE